MRNFLQQPAFRLAAMTLGLARVRAEEHRVDAAADLAERAVHAVVNGIERRHVEQTARDAGLIGGHYHVMAALGQAGDGLQTARDRFPLRRTLDIRRAVVIDYAVAVENDEFHSESRRMRINAWRAPRIATLALMRRALKCRRPGS